MALSHPREEEPNLSSVKELKIDAFFRFRKESRAYFMLRIIMKESCSTSKKLGQAYLFGKIKR